MVKMTSLENLRNYGLNVRKIARRIVLIRCATRLHKDPKFAEEPVGPASSGFWRSEDCRQISVCLSGYGPASSTRRNELRDSSFGRVWTLSLNFSSRCRRRSCSLCSKSFASTRFSDEKVPKPTEPASVPASWGALAAKAVRVIGPTILHDKPGGMIPKKQYAPNPRESHVEADNNAAERFSCAVALGRNYLLHVLTQAESGRLLSTV